MNLRNLAIAALALVGSLGVASSAMATQSAGVKVGVLTCHEASGWGFVFGSSRTMNCVFSSGANHTELYRGRISKFGVDVGYQRAAVLVWTVLAPTTDVAPGALAGAFGGATAGATVGVGGSANVLIGGSTHSLALEPLSFEGSTGLNVAAGIAALNLRSQPAPH